MDRHIARTIVRNSAGDARVIWSIFSGYHPQELRESGAQMQEQSDWLRLCHAKVTQTIQVRMKVHGTPVLYCIFL